MNISGNITEMPLTQESKRFVELRVEVRNSRMTIELYKKYEKDVNDEDDASMMWERIRYEIEIKLTALYNKGIVYWKERGDLENSERAAYAMQYYMKIVRLRGAPLRDRT